jgi:hypothetical protein
MRAVDSGSTRKLSNVNIDGEIKKWNLDGWEWWIKGRSVPLIAWAMGVM